MRTGKESIEAGRQIDNNSDPDLSAQAHNHTQHMSTCALTNTGEREIMQA